MVEMYDIETAREMNQAEEPADVKRGIHWTYRDILRGKSANILVISGVFLLAMSVEAAILMGMDGPSPGGFLGLLKDVLTLKAENFARDLCELIVVFIPMLLFLWPFVALILMAYYNFRDRKVPRTEKSIYCHEIEASKGWSWPWSVMVGTFDFTATFAMFIGLRSLLDNAFELEGKDAITIIFTIVCLVFAERRVRYTSRKNAAIKPGNHLTVCAVLDGLLDSLIPESMRTDLGRAKVATVISLGICRSPEAASVLVAGIDLRTKVKLFSGFLNSAIHGVLSALSFGIASTLANELGDVGGKFASGKDEELVAKLREEGTEKPYYLVEVIAIFACIFYTTYDATMYILSTMS